MQEVEDQLPFDELVIEIIKEEAEKINVSVDYYIFEFL